MENIVYDLENEFFNKNIFESRGVNDNYYKIIDEIVNELSHIKPELIDSSSNMYRYFLNHYDVKEESSFIERLTLYVFISPNSNGGSFYTKPEETTISNEHKLVNVFFNLHVYGENGKMSLESFRETFSHELHHAYRYYNILINNGSTFPVGEQYREKVYNDLNDGAIKAPAIMRDLFYRTDENEILAMCAEVYEVAKNKGINRENYKEHLDIFEPIQTVKLIDSILSYLKEHKNDSRAIDNFGKIYNSFLAAKNKKQCSNLSAFRLLKQFLNYKKGKILEQFYKVLGKAIMEQEKYISNPVMNIRNENILNKIVEGFELW